MIDNTRAGGMADFYDLIALPKGTAPGHPIQSSAGEYFIVIPINIDPAWHGRRAGWSRV